MIKIENISKKFIIGKDLLNSLLHPFQKNKEILALDSINLNIPKGESFGLLGPNGAGKTTLIKILSTLILPDEGNIEICGYDLKRQSQLVKSKIGLVTGEERSFYWRLTGRQNLEFFGVIYNLSAKQIEMRISELASQLELDDLDKPFQNYSTGIKHRLSLARCLISEPEVIFMDEPTRSLDPASAHNLRRFIKIRLVKELGKTIFFTTHQTSEAQDLADKIAVMDKGRIKACGAPRELNLKWGLNKDAPLENLYLKIVGQPDES
jgi:ABC-2 type transport system ATP-binding protein